ncbi:MAG: SLC13 family permease [Nitrososphaeraceae archaeon]
MIKFNTSIRSSYKRINKIGLIVGPLIFAIIFIIDIDTFLSYEAKIVLATTLWMSIWWITEAIPIYVTSLIPLIIFPTLSITDLGETSLSYVDRIIFLFLGGFILAKAIEVTKLHNRFALNILSLIGTKPKNIIAGFIIVTSFLSAWMSNTATAMLMIPIAFSIILQIKKSNERDNFAVCLLLAIAYSASIGGMATLIGTPPNAIFASLASELANVEVSFFKWMIIAMPISAISLFILWFYLVNVGSKIKNNFSIGEKHLISQKLKSLGKLNFDEKVVILIFSITAIAWITRGIIWGDFFPMIDDTTIVLVTVLTLFIIPSRILKTKINEDNDNNENNDKFERDVEVSKKQPTRKTILDWNDAIKIPWGVLLLIGGGLALADAFEKSGLDKFIANNLSFLKNIPIFIIILIIVFVTIIASEILSNTATAALFIPIAFSLSQTLSIDPFLLMVPIAIATSYGFIMPVGTPPNAIVFSTGHVTTRKMFKAGLPLDMIGVIIVSLFTTILLQLVWK